MNIKISINIVGVPDMTVAPRASIAFNAASELKPGCGNPEKKI